MSPGATASQTVLVADDDPDLVVLVARRLEKKGYHVVTACNGEEALKRARQYVPQLAVLDVMMPKLSGIEVMQRLRADPAMEGVRVVLISAGSQDNGPGGGAADADDFVKKPFSARELPDRVRAVLERAPHLAAGKSGS